MRPFFLGGQKLGSGDQSFFRGTVTVNIRHMMDRLALRLSDQCTFISQSVDEDIVGRELALSARVIYNSVPEFPEPMTTSTSPELMDLLYVGTYNTEHEKASCSTTINSRRSAKVQA